MLNIAKKHDGTNLSKILSETEEGVFDLVIADITNSRVEGFIGDLQRVDDLHFTLLPSGVLALKPPASEAAEQVIDVEHLSPIEIYLSGLQSVGSWKGFLGYTVAAAVVVWIGLLTNTMYLLIAAMLLAPFAGPAMNAAIATARGDKTLFMRSIFRYIVAIIITILLSAVLTWAIGMSSPTTQVVSTAKLSIVSVLLPLMAGAAGALGLVQSQRSSLVSGAAIGLLVSVSLAPPAGVAGMAAVLGRWDLVSNALFVLLMTVAGINLAGAVIFRLYGLSYSGARYDRGKKCFSYLMLGVSLTLLAGLVFLQVISPPGLQRASIEEKVSETVREAIDASGLAKPIDISARFTMPDIPGNDQVLIIAYVRPEPETSLSSAALSSKLEDVIRDRVDAQGYGVLPLVNVNTVSA